MEGCKEASVTFPPDGCFPPVDVVGGAVAKVKEIQDLHYIFIRFSLVFHKIFIRFSLHFHWIFIHFHWIASSKVNAERRA